MKKILITGATDGIGLVTATMLAAAGHQVIIHGRSQDKLQKTIAAIHQQTGQQIAGSYLCDLSNLHELRQVAARIRAEHESLDVLINNAGVYTTRQPLTADGYDVRLIVNMVAPYLLTTELLPILGADSRVVNLSSAAQAPVDLRALLQGGRLDDSLAYAQSKLGVTMWTNALAARSKGGVQSPLFVSVNPKSFLGTAMVRQAYGVQGSDVRVGADILCRAALSEEFSRANGAYYDNDIARFSQPHPAARDLQQCQALLAAMDDLITKIA